MSTVETTLDPKVPMWVQPTPLVWRPDARRIDGRTSFGKFTKELLSSADYDAETVLVERPWNDNFVLVEAVRLVLKDEAAERLHDLVVESLSRSAVTGSSFNVITEALVSTSDDYYMHNVRFIESRAVHYRLTETGEVVSNLDISGLLNAWTESSFPTDNLDEYEAYTEEWYAIERDLRAARNAIEDVRTNRWANFKMGNPVKYLSDLVNAAYVRDAQKYQREMAIEALKAAHPVSAIDKYRMQKAQEYIDAGFTPRGWNVDEDALDEMEYRWVTARLKKVLDTVGKTTLDTGLDHLPYSWRAMSVEEAFVINVDTAVMDIMRQSTRDHGGRRAVSPDLLFRFIGTFIEVLSGR